MSRTENQYRDQLNERNTLLLTVYQAVDKVAGADKVSLREFTGLDFVADAQTRSASRRTRPSRSQISRSSTTASSNASRGSINSTCRSSGVRKSSKRALSTSYSASTKSDPEERVSSGVLS